MPDHAERLLAASARWLHDATVETISDNVRISCAFIAGYNILQAIQPPYSGPLDDHPLASIVTNGAKRLGLTEPELTLGLALMTWEDFGRYQLEPSPVTVEGAIAWVERVRDAALKLQAHPP